MENLKSINQSLLLTVNGGVDTLGWLAGTTVCIGDGLIYMVSLLLLGLCVGA